MTDCEKRQIATAAQVKSSLMIQKRQLTDKSQIEAQKDKEPPVRINESRVKCRCPPSVKNGYILPASALLVKQAVHTPMNAELMELNMRATREM
jgi:hypothetical protein